MSGVLSPLMVGRLFSVSCWCLDGGKAIIILQTAVRDCGRDDLLSSLSLRSAGGAGQVVASHLK